MIDLLDELTSYLASHTGLTPGVSAFYNEMPDEPAKCIVIQEEHHGVSIPVQIDAEIHSIKITARDSSASGSKSLAESCRRWLITDLETYDEDKTVDTTGFITLPNKAVVHVRLYSSPVWEKADQHGRKYFCFYASIITPR